MRTTLVITALLLAAGAAHAEPMVVGIDGTQIYVDLGARDGVGDGAALELLHEVVAHDPRTGATLRDRFSLGALVVQRAGDHLCVALAQPEVAGRVALGDHVRLVTPAKQFEDPWAAQVAASKHTPVTPTTTNPIVTTAPIAGQPPTDHAALAEAAWHDTLGKPPEQRIARWQVLLGADPRTPYRPAIETEIKSLVAQVTARTEAIARAKQAGGTGQDRALRLAQLARRLSVTAVEAQDGPLAMGEVDRIVPGRDLVLSFLVRDPLHVSRAVLYARGADEAGFHRIDLVPDGDASLRGMVPAKLVRAPRLDWYVEVVGLPGVDGTPEVTPALGSAAQPRTIEVAADLAEAPVAVGRTHIDAHVDYVDFDGKLNKGFDQYYQAEVDFGYRFLDPIHAVRLGFGTLSGTGGPKDVIDAAPTTCVDDAGQYRCKHVTFSYIYLEFEHHIRENVALMIRPQAGLLTTDTMVGSAGDRCQGSNISDCNFYTALGVRGRIRLGKEFGTNLVLGAAFTAHVGTLFEAAYNWLPKPIVPVQLSVQVTDMPTPENFGVRLIGDVGLRSLTWFYPSVRVSYQARDLNHSGISGGFALNFDW